MKVLNQRLISDDGVRKYWVLLENNIPFAVCLTPSQLCVPFGEWIMKRHWGEKYKDVWEYQNVPGHTEVLIHWGTFVHDSKMCTLVAEKFGVIDNEPVIQESKSLPNEGFNELMNRTKGIPEMKIIVEKSIGWES